MFAMELTNAKARLAGGLDLIVSRNPAAMTLTLSLLARRGALDDPERKAGLAHLTEHVWASAEAQGGPAAQLVEEVGGNLEGTTYPLFVRLQTQVPIVHTDIGIKVMADLFHHGPSFGNTEVEKKAILAECHEAREDLVQRVDSLMWDALGRDGIYRGFRDALFSDLEGLTEGDVREWVARLGTDQYVLHAQTPRDPDELLATLSRTFDGQLRPGVPRTPRPFAGGRTTLVKVGRFAEEDHVALGTLFVRQAPGPREYAAAQVLSNLLVGGNRGRLQKRLRHEMGLVYDVVGWYIADYEMGSLEFYTFVEHGNEGQVVKVLLNEFAAAAAGDFTTSELARAKAFASGSYLVEMENPARVARWVTNLYLATGWSMMPTEWYDLLSGIEAGEVRQAAKALFEDSVTVWGVAVPPKATVDQTICELGPVQEVDGTDSGLIPDRTEVSA